MGTIEEVLQSRGASAGVGKLGGGVGYRKAGRDTRLESVALIQGRDRDGKWPSSRGKGKLGG